ncbi:MAG: Do family serine endopeptidase [Spirochaetes bacterium]|nr:Do family serine endopeptidase [Spirochaetota bacterium]
MKVWKLKSFKLVSAAMLVVFTSLLMPMSSTAQQDNVARQLQNVFNSVVEEVLPVVVEVNVVQVVEQRVPQLRSPFDFFFGRPDGESREFRRDGLGSGVIVRRDGDTVYVVSNAHVVGEADEIDIVLTDGREFEGRLIAADERTDLALVAFDTSQDVPMATLGDSDDLSVGDWVLAVGNPFGFESTVTVGIVSAVGREPEPGSPIAGFTDYIQTDAAINPGNSGGALVNLDGKVVGINTWIASRSGGSVGLGFAIPMNNAKRAINDFIEKGRISYGWLGVAIADLTEERFPGVAEALALTDRSGAFVTNVHLDSPADRAGVFPGDFIYQVAGESVENTADLSRAIGTQGVGSRVRLGLIRDGEERTVRVTLAERGTDEEIQDNSRLWPGFTVVELTDEMRNGLDLPFWQRGVVVSGVVPNTPAADAGLRRGDLISDVEEKGISSVGEFYQALNGARGDVSLEVRRRRETETLELDR